ncbi:Pleckstrin homology domain-containing protein [Rhodocollybia butyracea]|uniref:Pleckstrin homology domain-containing protein n=1 Tax=Rhodocollybia butyracea TaxID=206335 RepID=A0A9P5QAW8_9AGAR|nr:Pleckstrin homology domain-containing protein [Rhodocollybia butyracea]
MASTARILSATPEATTSASKLDDPSPQSEHVHMQRRFLLGPLPRQKVLPPSEKRNKRRHILTRMSSTESDAELMQIIKTHARSFFIGEGGREEDWSEAEEQSTREEMYQRWKDSEWGKAIHHLRGKSSASLHKNVLANNWIGGTFEIGTIAGVNIMSLSRASTQASASVVPLNSFSEPLSFPEEQSNEQQTQTVAPPLELAEEHAAQPLSPTGISVPEGEASRVLTPSSSTGLLHPSISRQHDSGPSQPQPEPTRHSIIKLPSFTRSNGSHSKGKKVVRYDLSPVGSSSSIPPASPTEVLERTGTDVSGTSAGAMSLATSDDPVPRGDVVMRDRMLVSVYNAEDVNVFSHFDESVHRVTRDLKYEARSEFLVVWRMDRIEIYDNYTLPGKEWFTGHKRLAFIIPLKEARTRLFLYSFVDLTFCITCSPTSRRFHPVDMKWTIQSSKDGSNLFIFKPMSRSRAYDWIWQLWRHRGGLLPPVVEIWNPRLDSKLKIDMPGNVDITQTYKIFSKDNLVALCIQSLREVPDFKYLIEGQLAEGNALQLCWREGSFLDWIWLNDDVDGLPRDWAVLCGLALKQSSTAHLELRLAPHHPGFVHRKDGTRLVEPPAIEGYVDRIKPNTNTKQALYLSSQGGNLFVLNSSDPHPPSPLPNSQLRTSEIIRGVRQVLDATGVIDLRSILIVRRANHPVMQHMHDLKEGDEIQEIVVQEISEADREDVGGEAGQDKQLKMRRSFELLLKNGHVIRFEAYSCPVCIEWVEKLQALVHYWKIKHRLDATEEMELAQISRPLITPHTYAEVNRTPYAESPVDPSAVPALGSIFNWCVTEGCKPIIKGGKVFMHRGLRGQYGLVDLVLLPEYLIHFRVSPKSILHSSAKKKISLVNAYVTSGYLASQMLPTGEINPDASNVPRRYADGLETDDQEEERLFVVWYTKAPATASSSDAQSIATDGPPLNVKRKFAIFRTRSKLERDVWVWALNIAIEKIVRARKERERSSKSGNVLEDL